MDSEMVESRMKALCLEKDDYRCILSGRETIFFSLLFKSYA